MSTVLASLAQTIIVSVQANDDEPLAPIDMLMAMAQSALNGGGHGLRLANALSIQAARQRFPQTPIIGITKPKALPAYPMNSVYITPTADDACSVLDAGADIVATDATMRPRPDGLGLKDWVSGVRSRYPQAVFMADIATLEEGLNAQTLGFDCVSTTLSGYTTNTQAKARMDAPDFDLLTALVQQCPCPVILEGRVWEPAQVTRAFELGAYAVVIGSAITRPQLITQRFVSAIPAFST